MSVRGLVRSASGEYGPRWGCARLNGTAWPWWRLYVAGRRIHHGAIGVVLTALGVVCICHDWKDRREWWPGRQVARG